MSYVKRVILILIAFLSGKTDYNNNKIPDSEEALGKIKKYLDKKEFCNLSQLKKKK